MKLIQNLSIRYKLLLIAVLPLLVLLYFMASSIQEKFHELDKITQIKNATLEIEAISDIINNLQLERPIEVRYIESKGKEGQSEIIAAQVNTDNTVSTLYNFLKEQGKPNSYLFLDKLPEIRNNIQKLSSSSEELVAPIGDLNTLLRNKVDSIRHDIEGGEFEAMMEEHAFLLFAKARLGKVRMIGQLAILADSMTKRQFADFALMKGQFELPLSRFHSMASGDKAVEYDKMMADPQVKLAKELIDSIYNHQDLKIDFSENTWEASISAFSEKLKKLEEYSIHDIKKHAEDKLAETRLSLITTIGFAVLIVLLIALILYYTIWSITVSLNEIKEAAESISKGEVNLQVSVNSKDEIGSLATSFNQLIAVTKAYGKAAESIGKGDYTVEVIERSNNDILGVSLNQMRTNLQALAKENERKVWLQTSNSELNDIMRGEKDLHQLSNDVVNKLAKLLNAKIGAIYLAENETLTLEGSYAFHSRKENNNVIKLGQGLVGQAALEKKPIIFTLVPDDYVKINSGLGSTSPRNILVYPFLFDGNLKGVIELGSAADFSDLDMEFMNLVAGNIGIAFNTAYARIKMKELLEETQGQAEELEAQQEEMRQVNEELLEKTNMLQNSEAQLKTQQEELQQTNEELEEKANLLEEQKEKLQSAKHDIEIKANELQVTSKYKSEFLANMSHELRTPLNSILILSQLLSQNKNKSLGEKEIEFANNINSSGADLLNLINEILDLSKIEAGKMELDIEEVELQDIKTDIQSMFEEMAKNKSIDFKIDFPKERLIVPFNTDKQRLKQIIKNLLSNAFKFTPKNGKVSLDISLIPSEAIKKITDLHRYREVLAFSVSDTGIGIPEDKQGLVFEAFQQADGSTKRKYGGTGLGLSISRELATALGGEILLKSEEGKGSTFTLYLPLEFNPSQSSSTKKEIVVKKPLVSITPKQMEDVPSSQETIPDDKQDIQENDKVILIIEDDLPFAKVLLDFVREKGYKGVHASQGYFGLSYARHFHPDAILLDMGLPVMDGSEVLKHLKSDPFLRHIPVQIISGNDRRKEGLELGAFDYIIKPVSQNDLNSALARIEEIVSTKVKKLLIIEDDKLQNNAVRELVDDVDVKPYSAYSGEEAMKMLLSDKFDCIIIDLGLPDINGFDLIEKIKANETLTKTPIIVYTGKDLNKAESAKLNKLANTVIIKTANSTERLLDETILFLHRVESNLSKEKQQIIRKLHRTDDLLQNKKILIVDDDIRNIYSLTNALEAEGVECISAENGIEALKLLKAQPDADIILMDIMMPEMDGYEATREIRKISKFSKLPIIALTAKAMKGDREKCIEAGMSDYISKPVNIEQLISLMRVWICH